MKAALELSNRDILSLALFALVELDERICQRRNNINFTGCLMESSNTSYLACQGEEMADKEPQELIAYAMQQLQQLAEVIER